MTAQEIKCDGCGMEATEDRWDYALVYPSTPARGDTRPRRVRVLFCPVCGKSRRK